MVETISIHGINCISCGSSDLTIASCAIDFKNSRNYFDRYGKILVTKRMKAATGLELSSVFSCHTCKSIWSEDTLKVSDGSIVRETNLILNGAKIANL